MALKEILQKLKLVVWGKEKSKSRKKNKMGVFFVGKVCLGNVFGSDCI